LAQIFGTDHTGTGSLRKEKKRQKEGNEKKRNRKQERSRIKKKKDGMKEDKA